MNAALDWISIILAAAGVFFFFAGSIGLIRLPDVYSRLHALSKADNLGLGMIAVAAMLQANSVFEIAKLSLIWILILIASACLCYIIANHARRNGAEPETSDES
ncbi:MAG: monovalent cation/H(+) antiporter subunit G [Verrucomicrobiota bacterium]